MASSGPPTRALSSKLNPWSHRHETLVPSCVRRDTVIGSPKTAFSLQRGPDPALPGVIAYHLPISNDYETYETSTPGVRRWLTDILSVLEQGIDWPLYVHCRAGKDHTGVVIATFLEILGVPHNYIVEEYLLSEGDVDRSRIGTALAGLAPVDKVFGCIELARVRRQLRG